MPPTKNGTLIIRLPLKLKQKIENLSKEKNISVSEFVRDLIEDSVFKEDKEIREYIELVNGLLKHIDHLLKESSLELDSATIEQYTKEIHQYKKLLYMNQSKVINLLSNKINIKSSELATFENDKKFINSLYEMINNISNYNKPYEKFFEDFNINNKDILKNKKEYYTELIWKNTDQLYSLMVHQYKKMQKEDEDIT